MKKCVQCGADVPRATCPTCGAVQPAKSYSDGAGFPWGRALVIAIAVTTLLGAGGYWVYLGQVVWPEDVKAIEELRRSGSYDKAWRSEAERRGWKMCPACGWTGRVGAGEWCVTCSGRGYK